MSSRYCICIPPRVDYDSMTSGLPGSRHPAQQGERPLLVEQLVEIAAFRALDTGGTAALAWTAVEHPGRIGDPALEAIEAAFRDPDAARVPVVDEDGRRTGVPVDVCRKSSDVPAVAHRPQRQQRDHRVLGSVERREERRHLLEAGEVVRG